MQTDLLSRSSYNFIVHYLAYMPKASHKATPTTSRNILLLLIFILALIFRVYKLGVVPASFYVEEMTNTYVGKFILMHGKDIYNHWLPLMYFDKFGDYPPVLPLYLSGLGALILGTSEFAGRFPLALIGALLVFPVYSLAYIFFQKRATALFAAFICALTPWHIVLSRTTAEGVVGLTVYAYAMLWILQGILSGDTKRIYKSFGLFFLTYFLYPGLRVLTPLTLLPLPFIFTDVKPNIKRALIYGIIGSFVLTAYISTTTWGQARFKQTSLFGDPIMRQTIQSRSESLSNMLGANQVTKARIFHNKFVLYSREFVSQYLSYFSPKYLFFESGGQFRYYNVPDQGLFFLAIIPFIATLLLLTQTTTLTKFMTYTLYILAIAPISAAITTDFVPHAHRSMFMILPIILLATGGFHALWNQGRYKKLFVYAMFVLMTFEIVYFWHQYAEIATSFQSTLRNDGDPEVVKYVIANRSKYEHVYLTKFDRIPLYYLFYADNFERKLTDQFEIGFAIKSVDNVTFVDNDCASVMLPVEAFSQNVLVVDSAKCEGKNELHGIDVINRHDGTSAYKLLTTQKPQ